MPQLIVDILSNKYVLAVLYILVCLILLKIVNRVFRGVEKKRGNRIKASFIKGLIKAAIVVMTVMQVASLSTALRGFSNTILMSSSLIVVVLGFIFQEGLSNIIHGFIITIFKPFDIGDRVQINVGGDTISGYVKSMTLRHTIITNIIDNAESIVPNSLIDNATIRNLTTQKRLNRYPLVVSITYKCAQDPETLKAAKKILSDCILKHPLTIDTRTDKSEPLFVKIDFAESSVDLTCFVNTDTAEQNYIVCSEIKEMLLEEYPKAGIHFAFRHVEISGSVIAETDGTSGSGNHTKSFLSEMFKEKRDNKENSNKGNSTKENNNKENSNKETHPGTGFGRKKRNSK